MYRLQQRLARRLPFFYGWVVLGAACCAGFARQGPAVATLTIFIVPMSTAFGWSAAEISGAVSLGGVLAALSAPVLGPLADRHGARAILCVAILMTAAAVLLLSLTWSLLGFYLLFCIARMNFAGPFDLGIYTAVNNWFVRLRPQANAVVTMALMVGLTAMPLIAHFSIMAGGWRAGWLAVGLTVLVAGFLPCFLLMARRPEDFGQRPDGLQPPEPGRPARPGGALAEPQFTRAQAMRMPAFWLLLGFILLAYPVQAGVSLHQAPHLLQRGLDPTIVATVVSLFSLISGVSGMGLAMLVRPLGVRATLCATGLFLVAGCLAMIPIETAAAAYLSVLLFGVGIGGLLTIPPIAWADFFGRASFGAIRGVVLAVQVVAQAAGPLIAGLLRDWTGDHVTSLWLFAAFSAVAALVVLAARPPRHSRLPTA